MMNPDDEFQAWLNARRGESPPADLTDRIMSAVREPKLPGGASPSRDMLPKTSWWRAFPYLVCSAAALLLTVRLYSIVSLFVVASPVADIALIESEKELSHEP